MTKDRPNQEHRAALAWPVLVRQAAAGEPITYGSLAESIGVHPHAVGWLLSPIQDYCLAEKLPPLTILVVQKGAGRPGGGFIAWDTDDFDKGLSRVYAFDWASLENPFGYALEDGRTQETLAQDLVDAPERSEEVYARVRVRGIAQSVFRDALLRAYGRACAFCGFSFTEALEGAHIVPWSECAARERMDPRNGLLLCSTHHQLFDAGWLTITEDLSIRHPEANGAYSDVDEMLTRRLHGQRIRLPKNPNLRPDPKYIKRRQQATGS